jgi:mannose-1-phosphate guanylyltransferase
MNVQPTNANVRVLLTAAGIGSRLRPITDTLPKALVPIAGRPLLDYWFDAFEAAGIRHILVNTHHLPDQLRVYFGTKNATGRFEAVETHEPTLLGSAGTIAANDGFVPLAQSSGKVIGDEVLIIYSDNLSNIDLAKFLAYHRSHPDPFTMLLFRAQFPEKSGIAELAPGTAPTSGPFATSACGKIVSFIEKPKQPKSNLANAGLYAMSAALWHEIAAWKAFDIGFDVLPRLVGRMHAIEHGPALARESTGGPTEGYHRDIGTHESLAIAEADAARVFAPRNKP